MGASVRLFGAPAITVADETYQPRASKISAVLYCVAYQPDWVRREELLGLFWPDRPELHARNNLRQLLSTLKGRPYAVGLEIGGERMRWTIPTDVDLFRAADKRSDAAAVRDVYDGELLEGFENVGSHAFESWLTFERQELLHRWSLSILDVARTWKEQGSFDQAIAVYDEMLAIAPWDERTFQMLLETLGEAGRIAEAELRFEQFERALDHAVGEDPSAETRAALASLQGMQPSPGGSDVAASQPEPLVHSPLPRPLSMFVGRSAEIAEIEQLLLGSECRFLNVVGPGGMGKTRLALEVAWQLRTQFLDGVAYASLAGETSVQGSVERIASAFGSNLTQRPVRTQRIARLLRDRHVLLVLDNLETVDGVGSILNDLLEETTELVVLGASRVRLGLLAEWTFDLQGLVGPGPDGGDHDRYEDAAELFVKAAQRTSGTFEPDADRDAIERICRITGGMPLALELAAGWVRIMPTEQIADELDRDLDLLTRSETDGLKRHQSVHAAVDGSWKALSDDERRAMIALSVFAGGFTREAAEVIAGVGTAVLLALVNRSFLTFGHDRRFRRHPLIEAFVRKRAIRHASVVADLAKRHAEYFSDMLERVGEPRDDLWPSNLRKVEDDAENVRAAWRWAVSNNRWDLAAAMLKVLGEFHMTRGTHKSFLDDLAAAYEIVTDDALRSRIARHQIHHHLVLEAFDAVIEIAEAELANAETLAPEIRAWTEEILAMAYLKRGMHDAARSLWERTLRASIDMGWRHLESRILMNLSMTSAEGAERDRLQLAAIEAARDPWNPVVLVRQLANHAIHVEVMRGDHVRAHVLAYEAVEVARDGDVQPARLAHALVIAAVMAQHMGKVDEAVDALREAEALIGRTGTGPAYEGRYVRWNAALAWARHYLILRDPATAWEHSGSQLVDSRFANHTVTAARLRLEMGDPKGAERWIEQTRRVAPTSHGLMEVHRGNIMADLLHAELVAGTGDSELAIRMFRRAAHEIVRRGFLPLALEALLLATQWPEVHGERVTVEDIRDHPATAIETRVRAAATDVEPGVDLTPGRRHFDAWSRLEVVLDAFEDDQA